MYQDIFTYITSEAANYRTQKVPITDSYDWSMYEHVRISTLYRDSKYATGADDGSRPFKNIIRRIINLEHVATGFDVKDIQPYVNEAANYYKSFLARKFHAKWARANDIDTFIDKTVESYVDYGLALSKHVNNIAPEDVPLASIAFCDQTDVLSGPICLRHNYSPAQLLEYKGKWIDDAIDEVIVQARADKKDNTGKVIKTPGKFIEVFELDGMFPRAWMKDPEKDNITEEDQTIYTQQFHIVSYYKSTDGDKKGISLFKGKGDPKKYKAKKRDDIWGRACGFGGIEELFEDQVWTNYNVIRMQALLDYCSKVINVTTDAGVASKYKLKDMEMGDFVVQREGGQTAQLNNTPGNINLFNQAITQWESHAQGLASANPAILGESPSSGTPFKLQDLLVNQSEGPHEYRKGQMATYIGEIYRDWVLKDLVKEMNNEQEFVAELSVEELKYCVERVEQYETDKMEKQKVLSGMPIYPDETDTYKQDVRKQFLKGGNKKFFKILKDELKDLPVDVEVNVAGKQKDLNKITDKMTNLLRQIFANPQGFKETMQIDGMPEIFNQILEYSGLNEVDFLGLTESQPVAPTVQAPAPAKASAPVLQ